MSRNQNSLAWTVTASIVSVATFVTFVVVTASWLRQPSLPSEQLDVLGLVHERILDDYVFEQNPEELMYRAIEGMVASLDEYSRFVPPSEVTKFEGDEITGTYEGIGILLVAGRVPLTVQWPFPGGPAERAGLRVGDEIVAVNDTTEIPFDQAAERMRGPAGSTVRVRIRRGDQEQLEVDVARGPVRKPAVKWGHLVGDPADRVAYLHIAEFQQGMVDSFDAEIARLRDLVGGELGGLVVDLRSNPGGLLTESIELSNRFLESGTIVSLKRRGGETVETHVAAAFKCKIPDTPTVLIVDRRSASASEVFAAALQDHDRAKIVGERTYGKGVVQQIYNWPGRDFRLKMTSSHYYTPSGRNIARTLRRDDDGDDPGGVDPDRAVALTRKDSNRTAAQLGAFETPRQHLEQVESLAARLEFEIPRAPAPDKDPCLEAALAILARGEDGK